MTSAQPYTPGQDVQFHDGRGWRMGRYVGPASGYATIVERGRTVPTHVVQQRGVGRKPRVVGEGHIRVPPAAHILQGWIAVMQREDGGFLIVGPADTSDAAKTLAEGYKTIFGDPLAIIELPGTRFNTGDGI